MRISTLPSDLKNICLRISVLLKVDAQQLYSYWFLNWFKLSLIQGSRQQLGTFYWLDNTFIQCKNLPEGGAGANVTKQKLARSSTSYHLHHIQMQGATLNMVQQSGITCCVSGPLSSMSNWQRENKKMERDAERERKVRCNVTMNNLRIVRQKSNRISIMIQYIQVLSIYLHTELHRHTHIVNNNNNTKNKNNYNNK